MSWKSGGFGAPEASASAQQMRLIAPSMCSRRETMVCRRRTVEAAITTGSIEVCGCEPWEPRPCRVTCPGAFEAMAPSPDPWRHATGSGTPAFEAATGSWLFQVDSSLLRQAAVRVQYVVGILRHEDRRHRQIGRAHV